MESKQGCAYINATFTSTSVQITDLNQNNISSSLAIGQGFGGCNKNLLGERTNCITKAIAETALNCGIETVDVFCKGSGIGLEIAIRTLLNSGLKISMIKDNTPANIYRPVRKEYFLVEQY